jgi:hypothetical protein
MENAHSTTVGRYSFLEDEKASQLFAKVDYLLRSGVHLQREYPGPQLFRFVDAAYSSGLLEYYSELFNLCLCKDGTEFNHYYYLDFEEEGRLRIPKDQRDTLKTEYLLTGMLFFKFYRLDGNFDLEKVSDFVNLLFAEYEEEKECLRKLIIDTAGEKGTDFSDEKIRNMIGKAFDKFSKLGWIAWEDEEKDRFAYMPSFERLRTLYQPQILKVEELIKSACDNK